MPVIEPKPFETREDAQAFADTHGLTATPHNTVRWILVWYRVDGVYGIVDETKGIRLDDW